MKRKTLDIYAEPGTHVIMGEVFDEQANWAGADDPRKYLVPGTVYTVAKIEIHSQHTRVFLREIPDRWFNHVCFEETGTFHPISLLFREEKQPRKDILENWEYVYKEQKTYPLPRFFTKEQRFLIFISEEELDLSSLDIINYLEAAVRTMSQAENQLSHLIRCKQLIIQKHYNSLIYDLKTRRIVKQDLRRFLAYPL